ncbi:MAG: S24/S26 family peptidase [Oscillospiraceae bacterium]|nr:S24/S26 family peptidase [Oscillospiraceae bacterium]
MTKFEDVIAHDGRLVYTNVGDSMLPLIRQGRDLLIIEKPHGRLKKYAVPLYRRDSGQYVLHRVLKVRDSDYVICGDNRYNKEYGITDRHIIGVLTAVVRDGREIPVTALRYRLCVHLWCDFFPVRALILKAKKIPKRLKRRYEK